MLLDRAIGPAVVLVLVDLLAGVVLLMIDLGALLRGELAAIGSAVVSHFAVDIGFAMFQMTGFMRSQLPRLNPIRDALLLMGFASVDAAHRSGCGPAVIF